MFGQTRLNSFDDVFTFQRDVDRAFNQFWNDLPARTPVSSPSFQVTTTDDGWRVDVPMPGIDPKGVSLEVAGNNLTIRAEVQSEGEGAARHAPNYEQTLIIPPFLDLEKLTASHRHGMLRLTLPLKESVKPRRVEIEIAAEGQKHLAGTR
jgi:HSP20 family protein